jgi:hypothetical protein
MSRYPSRIVCLTEETTEPASLTDALQQLQAIIRDTLDTCR